MRKLVHHAALDLLPGGLATGNLEPALLRQRLFAAVVLRLADQDSGGTLVQIDANPVTGFQDREPAPGCRFRGSVQDRRIGPQLAYSLIVRDGFRLSPAGYRAAA